MNDRDKKKLAELITLLAEAFRQAVTPATLLAYHIGLKDLPIATLEPAIEKAIRECKFMPSVAELRALAGEMSVAQRASLAFEAVALATKTIGYCKSVNFDDPLTNAAIRNLGGWERLCQVDDREEFEKWIRKDFERVYTLLSQQDHVARERCLPLLGYYDRENSLRGYPVQPPVEVKVGLPPARNWPSLSAPESVAKIEERPSVKLLPGLGDMGAIK